MTGRRSICHGLVAKQTGSTFEYLADAWVLFDQLCGGRSDTLCSLAEFRDVSSCR